jgi:hypothetical protein
MVNEVAALASAASIAKRKEQLHRVTLDGTDRDNPRIDIILHDVPDERPELAVDVTVQSVLKTSGLAAAAATPLAAGNAAAKAKALKWQRACEAEGMGFLPLVWESHGGMTRDTLLLLDKLMNRLDGSDWCPPNWAAHTPAQFWWQRLSVTLHHANADTVIYLARELVRLHGPARRGL